MRRSGRGLFHLQPAFSDDEGVAGNRFGLAMKLQLKSVGKQRLKHEEEFRSVRRTLGLRVNFIMILIKPVRTSFDLIVSQAVPLAICCVRPAVQGFPSALQGVQVG